MELTAVHVTAGETRLGGGLAHPDQQLVHSVLDPLPVAPYTCPTFPDVPGVYTSTPATAAPEAGGRDDGSDHTRQATRSVGEGRNGCRSRPRPRRPFTRSAGIEGESHLGYRAVNPAPVTTTSRAIPNLLPHICASCRKTTTAPRPPGRAAVWVTAGVLARRRLVFADRPGFVKGALRAFASAAPALRFSLGLRPSLDNPAPVLRRASSRVERVCLTLQAGRRRPHVRFGCHRP